MVEGLELNEADDGLVVYQESRDWVHHLNATAALILQLCDGTHDADAIAAFLARGFEMDEPPLEETRACLAKLAEEGLIR
jgi:PqqD family protein of HPr-rel-A system